MHAPNGRGLQGWVYWKNIKIQRKYIIRRIHEQKLNAQFLN